MSSIPRNSWGDPIAPPSGEGDWTASEIIGDGSQEQPGKWKSAGNGGGKPELTRQEARVLQEVKSSSAWWDNVGRLVGGAAATFLYRRSRPSSGLIPQVAAGLCGTLIGEALALPVVAYTSHRKIQRSVDDPEHLADVLKYKFQEITMRPMSKQEVISRRQQDAPLNQDFKGFSSPGIPSSASSSTSSRSQPSRQEDSEATKALPAPSFTFPPDSDPFAPSPFSSSNREERVPRRTGSRWAELRQETASGESAWARLRRGEGVGAKAEV